MIPNIVVVFCLIFQSTKSCMANLVVQFNWSSVKPEVKPAWRNILIKVNKETGVTWRKWIAGHRWLYLPAGHQPRLL